MLDSLITLVVGGGGVALLAWFFRKDGEEER